MQKNVFVVFKIVDFFLQYILCVNHPQIQNTNYTFIDNNEKKFRNKSS